MSLDSDLRLKVHLGVGPPDEFVFLSYIVLYLVKHSYILGIYMGVWKIRPVSSASKIVDRAEGGICLGKEVHITINAFCSD
jgi:hypothetical protein